MGDNKEPSINRRANYAIGKDPDLFISIHTNADVPTARGVEVWKWSVNDKVGFRENTLANLIYTNEPVSKLSPIFLNQYFGVENHKQ